MELKKLHELIELKNLFLRIYLSNYENNKLKAAYQYALEGKAEEFSYMIDLYWVDRESSWKAAVCSKCSALASELLILFKNDKENPLTLRTDTILL